MAKGGKKRRSAAARAWDRENPPSSYRLDGELPDEVRSVVAWYKARGLRVSQGGVVSDLLWYALDAWRQGLVAINCTEIESAVREVRRESA